MSSGHKGTYNNPFPCLEYLDMKTSDILHIALIVCMLSSCAYKGEYYFADKVSTRYGALGGANWSQTQLNQGGRGDSRFREPTGFVVQGWNAEPRANHYDEYGAANYYADKEKSKKKNSTGRLSIMRTKAMEKYEDRVALHTAKKGEKKKNAQVALILDNAKDILALEKKVAEHPGYKKHKQFLYNMEYAMKYEYKEGIMRVLRKLQGIYHDIHDTSQHGTPHSIGYHLSVDLLEKLKSMKKEFRNASPIPYFDALHMWAEVYTKCALYYLSDGEKHKSADYTFSYLFGDPEKVSDKSIACIMFGDSIRKHFFEYEEVEDFMTNEENKDYLGKYYLYDAENKWFMVTMGKNKVYLQIKKINNTPKITGIINPARDLCVITE